MGREGRRDGGAVRRFHQASSRVTEAAMKNVTIIVGTVGQSIMRSEDSGQTWMRIGPRRGFAYEASVRTIAMYPREHKILFAGTERGLYRSEDAGANWRYLDSALNLYYVWALAIDPQNPDVM